MGFPDEPDSQHRLLLAGKIIAIVILTIALLPWPYGFYLLVRWLVFPVFAVAAIRSMDDQGVLWTWVFVYLSILYNPFVPLGLSRSAWSFFDVASIVVVVLSFRSSKKTTGKVPLRLDSMTPAVTSDAANIAEGPMRVSSSLGTSTIGPAFQILGTENRWYPHNPHIQQIAACRELALPLAVQHLRTGIPLILMPRGVFVMGLSTLEEKLRPAQPETFGYASGEIGTKEFWQSVEHAANSIDRPRHTVSVRPFYMGVTPVTHAQWSAVCPPIPSHPMGPVHPVDQVSWNEVQQFLSDALGSLRLPSEAEWEYAARAFSDTRYWWGNQYVLGSANLFQGDIDHKYAGETTEPGTFPANQFGLFDMIGNVEQWCQDRWHPSYAGAPSDGSAWEDRCDKAWKFANGPGWESHEEMEGMGRVVRGSQCKTMVDLATCGRRGYHDPGSRHLFRGFRVALDPNRLQLIEDE